MDNLKQTTEQIKKTGLDLGFQKVGLAPAEKLERAAFLEKWLHLGHHGSMHWMENYLDKRLNINKLFPQARSVISVAHNYFYPRAHSGSPDIAKISRYAWGRDYHKIIKKKLKTMLARIKQLEPSIEGRIFVDTAPIQDKLWAARAGIGWQGKNTNIISKEYGSWLFLGEIVINQELIYDPPAIDHCGSCTACLEACPTGALQAYQIDARKCLAYLTIEMWDQSIPTEHAGKMQNWVFGCDICQDVCPWNRHAQPAQEAAYAPLNGNEAPTLTGLAAMTEQEFNTRFKNSPVKRAKYKNFMRNVFTVLKHEHSEH